MKKKLCYHELIKQLQENPELTPEETLKDLRTWIDYVKEEYGNLPLGLLQAYAYILTTAERWKKMEEEK